MLIAECNDFAIQAYASVNTKWDFYETELTQTSRLSFVFKKDTTLSQFWLVLRDTQNLLTLLVGEPVYPIHQVGALPGTAYKSVSIVRHSASSSTPGGTRASTCRVRRP